MQSRVFTLDEQLAFARLSGDYNELHVDPVVARRSLFGAPVVHGINALLWALDTCLPETAANCRLDSLQVLFIRQIRVGDEVHVATCKITGNKLKIKLATAGTTAISIAAEMTPRLDVNPSSPTDDFPQERRPLDLPSAAIGSANGSLDLFLPRAAVEQSYPHLVRCLSADQLATLLCTTRLVGGHCPGRYSVFSELELRSADNNATSMAYQVESVDQRFDLVTLQLVAPGAQGMIRAFQRPVPQQQADYSSLLERVDAEEFAAQRALIIGGSRGLGELAAKLLAAGGADVKITYLHGSTEASTLVEEITSGGGSVSSFAYDVLNPLLPEDQVSVTGWFPTHLYFFATPFIFSGVSGQFSARLFREFSDFYVGGLSQTLAALGAGKVKRILCPSSVALDDPPANLGEYAAAKAAAEMLGAFVESIHPGTRVYEPRLPRLATDQTANIMGVPSQDPVPVMLTELRAFGEL